jgi:hypothetical protein
MKNGIMVTRMSDNLMKPKVYVAEIRKYPDGRVSYGIQFAEDAKAAWSDAVSEEAARKAINATVKAHRAANKPTHTKTSITTGA